MYKGFFWAIFSHAASPENSSGKNSSWEQKWSLHWTAVGMNNAELDGSLWPESHQGWKLRVSKQRLWKGDTPFLRQRKESQPRPCYKSCAFILPFHVLLRSTANQFSLWCSRYFLGNLYQTFSILILPASQQECKCLCLYSFHSIGKADLKCDFCNLLWTNGFLRFRGYYLFEQI